MEKERYSLNDIQGRENIKNLDKVTKDYSSVGLDQLLIYVMDKMEKNNIRLSEPNISLAAWVMFPDKFSIFGWPEYPCSKRTNLSCLHMKYKNKRWITGTSNQYLITEKGRKIVEETTEFLESDTQKKQKRKSYSKTRRQDKLVSQIKKTTAYVKYTKGKEISQFDLYEMLQCTLDSSGDVLKENYDALCIYAAEAECEEVIEFLTVIKNNFEEIKNV